ncbi:MAG: hypothetical protein ACOZCO_16945 [Bacteroidota bacterium]
MAAKKKSFSELIKQLSVAQRRFDAESITATGLLLSDLKEIKLTGEKSIQHYHDSLLFILAYPASENILKKAEKELKRVIGFVQSKNKSLHSEFLLNSGISGSNMCASFTLEFNRWLMEHYPGSCEFDSVEGDKDEIYHALSYTQDPVEAELKPEEKQNKNYFFREKLQGLASKKDILRFYVSSGLRLPGNHSYKENLFSSFRLYTRFRLGDDFPTLSSGRFKKGNLFYHTNGIIRKTTLAEIFSEGKPVSIPLTKSEKTKLSNLARASMGSLMRETDPFSFPNQNETELLDMGRGITIALFYMTPEMKYPLQVYAGYLLMKNHIPMAYGGGWILGRQSGFGVNVLPPFRGGESAWVVGQLLRAYKFSYNVSLFSVDPYQIGKNNAEGIKSGAFWFYYRLGFRPLQKELFALAEKEWKKISEKKNYRTPEKILKLLAHSTLLWEEKNDYSEYIDPDKVSLKTTEWINNRYKGDRQVISASSKSKKETLLNKNKILLEILFAYNSISENEKKYLEDFFILKATDEKQFTLRSGEMIQKMLKKGI